MRTKVIEVLAANDLQPNQRFNKLLELMPQIPGVSPHQFRYFNQVGFTPQTLSAIEYDLKKVLNIKDTEIMSYNTEVIEESEPAGVVDCDKMSYAELKAAAQELQNKTGVKPANQKKDTLIEYLSAADQTAEANPFDEAPEDVKEALKLRDIYPFLREKDIPNEYKILVADKITAFEQFVQAREELAKLEGTDNFEKMASEAAKAVENFELDIIIHDELAYFQENRKVLGKHPIFEDYVLQEKVLAYSAVELVKRQKTLRANISRDKNKLKSITDPAKKENFEKKILEWEKELSLVDVRIESVE